MDKKRQRTKKKSGERDVVLRAAVAAMLVWMVIGSIVFAVGVMNPREDPRKGLAQLEQMEEADTAAIDAQIQAFEEVERAADEAWANRTVDEKFANSMVLGDFIARGLYEYGVMSKSYVTAEQDTGVCVTAYSMIENHVSRAIEEGPQVLFLAYGLNDVKAASGDAEVFVKAYKVVLEKLKDRLPETKIYVNSVLPVQDEVVEENELYGSISRYNKELEKLCGEEEVTFIDNSDLAKDKYYSDDGIRMTEDYYTAWTARMAEIAQL